MTGDDIARRAAELRAELHKHIYHYNVLSAPLISDAEYDALYNALKQIEAEHPELITPDSPTQRAGSDLSEDFPKIRHPAPILSLSNGYTADDIRAWEERNLKLLPTGTQLGYTLGGNGCAETEYGNLNGCFALDIDGTTLTITGVSEQNSNQVEVEVTGTTPGDISTTVSTYEAED